MICRTGIFAVLAGLSLLVVVGRPVRAADSEAMVQQITALNKSAIAAYSDGDFAKAKKLLLQAVALGKKDSSLLTHPLMGRTYLHLGVLYVDGIEDRKAGVRYFAKALQIRPDIQLTEALATKTVKSAFEEAGAEAGPGAEGTPAVAASETDSEESAPVATKGESKAARAATAREEKAAKEAAAKEEKASRAEAAQEEKASREQGKQAAKAAAEEKKQAEAEARQKDKQAQTEKDKLMKELAQSGSNEAKERAAKEKLQGEKTEKERSLTEAKEALAALQKESKENEKQALAEKDKLTKELAQVRDSEAKERAAKEKLQGEKADKEKALAAAQGTIQQLQKEKADKEKLLADTGAREKKEKEAKEKLEKERQVADAHEKERKAQEESERLEREKLAAGPDVPAHFSQAIYCSVPDEAQAGADLYVHCVAQPNLKAKELAFYYRPNGGISYNSVALEHSKKGWQRAIIPGEKLTGKAVQYYVEARTDRGAVAAANGKANSPNILTLKPAAGGGAGRTRAKSR